MANPDDYTMADAYAAQREREEVAADNVASANNIHDIRDEIEEKFQELCQRDRVGGAATLDELADVCGLMSKLAQVIPCEWPWCMCHKEEGKKSEEEKEPRHQIGCICADCSGAELTSDND